MPPVLHQPRRSLGPSTSRDATSTNRPAASTEPIGVAFPETRLGDERRLAWVVWGLVALGIVVRLVRYLIKPPLWGDEAFVAANFIERGYLDMLRPLDYHQVCPLLFMWVELSVVKLAGFSEWTLRLVPTAASIGSLLLFRHLAMRLLRGLPLVLSVGMFAVAYYPIRHGNEVKPYATDLFVALVLLVLAVQWWRAPQRSGWLWALAAFVPIAVGLSHPAVFVGGAISLALLPRVWRPRDRRSLAAFATLNVAMVATFVVLMAVFTAQQYEREFAASMRHCWQESFPPLSQPLHLAGWMVKMHTGRMLAYPVGGADGGSTLTFILLVVGAVAVWRHGQRGLLAMLLLPFALTFIAAAMERYPYGGSARTMQYVAPAVCLLAGLGLAILLTRLPTPRAQLRGAMAALGLFVLFGAGSMVRDLVKPYKTIYDEVDRGFAIWLWRDMAHEAELVCAYADLGHDFYPGCFEWGHSALYRCNQEIYSPRHRQGPPPNWEAISADHPLRCVVYSIPGLKRDDELFAAWMADMTTRYELIDEERYLVNSQSIPYREALEIYEFVPRADRVATSEHTNENPPSVSSSRTQ